MSTSIPIDTMPDAQFEKAIESATAHIEKAIEALPFLLSLTTEQRQHTSGKLRNGEDKAIAAVIDTVAAHPAPFASLHLDPVALRKILARRGILAPLVELVGHLSDDLTDSSIHLGEAVHDPVKPAYNVATALAPHDPALASTLQPAKQFYGEKGRAAARTRQKNKEQAATAAKV